MPSSAPSQDLRCPVASQPCSLLISRHLAPTRNSSAHTGDLFQSGQSLARWLVFSKEVSCQCYSYCELFVARTPSEGLSCRCGAGTTHFPESLTSSLRVCVSLYSPSPPPQCELQEAGSVAHVHCFLSLVRGTVPDARHALNNARK